MSFLSCRRPCNLMLAFSLASGMLCLTATGAFAAAAASADENGGYAGRMLHKVIAVWAPPPGLKGDFQTSLKVSVDGTGKVVDCKPVKPSAMEALDSSACGAVRQIGTFGAPPHNAPLDVHLSFWTGTPKGKPRPETLSTEEALRAEVRARAKAEAAMGDTHAASAEERARERAEALARDTGQDLPQVRPAPVAPPAAQRPPREKKRPIASPGPPLGLSDDTRPATQIMGRSAPQDSKPAPTKEPQGTEARTAAQTPPTEPLAIPQPPLPKTEGRKVVPSQEAGQSVEAPAAGIQSQNSGDGVKKNKKSRYLSSVAWQLSNAVIIPAETAPGQYETDIRLVVEPDTGVIKNITVLRETGDSLLDKYVRRGIRRAGSVPPPPAGFGHTLDITLTLVRR